ncbi:hypothetical protein TNCV_927971 [Trichonephila clavipes]|nr:hypothetical protein TNCV_927971 [Trichonephila clavipes]
MLSADPDAVANPVAVERGKGLSRDSSNVPLISAEDEIEEEKPKLPKRKLKKLNRMTVAELQQKVNLKASSNVIIIPRHWCFKLQIKGKMTDNMETNPAMDLDNELINGMDDNAEQQLTGNETELPLPQDAPAPELHTSPTANRDEFSPGI